VRGAVRIAIAEIKQESNSFSPVATTLQSFEDGYLLFGDEIVETLSEHNCEIAGFLDETPHQVVPTLAAWSLSGGPLTRETFEFLMEELLDRISAAGHLDGILLALHGSMLADGVDDADGRILDELRTQCGAGLAVVATLDLHANITRRMLESCDLLVPYRTYPHVDQRETGARAARFLSQVLTGELVPTSVVVKLPMLVPSESQATTESPMVTLVKRSDAIMSNPLVVNVSLLPVQPWLDVDDLGFAVLVTANADPVLAESCARELAVQTWAARTEFRPELVAVEDAVRRAASDELAPVVLADSADSTASGSPGDGTAILDALLHTRLRGRALITLVDADVVNEAAKAGVGARMTRRLGGKLDHVYNRPVLVTFDVERIVEDGCFRMSGPAFTGIECSLGRAVVLAAGQVRILVTEHAVWTHDPALYRAVGLEPADAQVIVVKSPYLFKAAYSSLAQTIIHVDGPGTSSSNFARLPYSRIPHPLWPLDPIDCIDGSTTEFCSVWRTRARHVAAVEGSRSTEKPN
jgi:microcystin degradation protein MlrC